MRQRLWLRRSERGAMLVQTAVSILMLMGFTVFVCDYGVVLVSRGQAQNAADAGALAGALAMQFDISDSMNTSDLAAVVTPIATAAAVQNPIWNSPGTVTVQYPVCDGVPGTPTEYCIQVSVYRNGTNGSTPLPVFFAPLLGIDWQGVGARAWGRVRGGNATNCMRPFAISDRFVGDENSTFDGGESYAAPTSITMGSTRAFNVPEYFGTELLLKEVPPEGAQVGQGWFHLLDLDPAAGGPLQAIRACRNDIYGIGDDLTAKLHSGVGNGIIKEAVDSLIALDPLATWDSATKRIQNSCAQTSSCSQYDETGANVVPDPTATASPRVVALPVVNPQRLAQNDVVEVVNFVGFFLIEAMQGPSGPEVLGVLLTKQGLLRSDKPSIYNRAAFLRTSQLVR